ncbi:hypothetical protein Leryth_017556 [Lithospermum erythrorhizon]|nr:hypothetical protein Leryth_017556 [Lithospermum erythrorhizon]
MPQVDLVSACAGGSADRKIACETLAESDEKPNLSETKVVPNTNEQQSHDVPPESFWLSKDAELDWMDQNAFFERKESTKGISSHHPQQTSASNSNSQRFSLNLPSKSAILGLPKTQKASFIDAKRRNANKPGNTRLFPKRTGVVVGKPAGSLTEPASPKVSCMGRVRSKRRSRRSSEPEVFERSMSRREKNKTGCCAEFMKIFKSGGGGDGGGKKDRKPVREPVEEVPRKSLSGSRRASEFSITIEPGTEPVGLGGMKRFASGRRSTDSFDGVVAGSVIGEPPGLGGMKRFSSGRRSTDEFEGGIVS